MSPPSTREVPSRCIQDAATPHLSIDDRREDQVTGALAGARLPKYSLLTRPRTATALPTDSRTDTRPVVGEVASPTAAFTIVPSHVLGRRHVAPSDKPNA